MICELNLTGLKKKNFNFYIGLRLTPGQTKEGKIAIQWTKYSMMADEQFEKYEVQYETIAGETYIQDVNENGDTPSFVITGLKSATGYKIRVRVLSKDFGYSEDSEELMAYTDEHSASDLSTVEILGNTLVSNHFSIQKKILDNQLNVDEEMAK